MLGPNFWLKWTKILLKLITKGNFIKYDPSLFKLQKKKKNAPFKNCLKNILGPDFWLEMDKNNPKT